MCRFNKPERLIKRLLKLNNSYRKVMKIMQILIYILLAICIIAFIYLVISSFIHDTFTFFNRSYIGLIILMMCTVLIIICSLTEEQMKNKYTVIGVFRQTNENCDVETLSDLSYHEALKIKREWKKQEKYKDVFYFKQD